MPKPRDHKERPPIIPQAVLEAQAIAKQLERYIENENGGVGVYSAILKKHYILANDDGRNIFCLRY